jgi:hypothetical protein
MKMDRKRWRKSASITVSVPPKRKWWSNNYNKYPVRRDDDLGLATVQFSDNIDQVYNVSYANIKRRK